MTKRNTETVEETDEGYDAILDRAWDTIPTPQNLPDGDWLVATTAAKLKAPEGKAPAKVQFFHKAVEPLDVDPEALEALGDYDPQTTYIEPYEVALFNASDWDKVRNHLRSKGIEPNDYASIRESLAAAKGAQSIAYVSTREYETKLKEKREVNTLSDFRKFEG